MKTVSTIIATSLLLASLGASAGAVTGSDIISTQVAPTKAAAYQLGMNKLAQLKTISPLQLGQSLNIPLGNVDENTIRLNDEGYVTLQERMGANGQVGYVGQANVSFTYEVYDSSN